MRGGVMDVLEGDEAGGGTGFTGSLVIALVAAAAGAVIAHYLAKRRR